MTAEIKLSAQQYRILNILWERGESSTGEVQQAFPGDLAHTTIGTMLVRLERRGILSSFTRGRERVYRPIVERGDVRRSMVSDLVSNIFNGDAKALVAHLVEESEINQDELEAIRKLIEGEDK